MAKDKQERRGVYLYIDDKEINSNIKSVENEMQTLVRAQKKMTIGSIEYVQAGEKIRSLKSIIYQHNQSLKATTQALDENKSKMRANTDEASSGTKKIGKLADGFNRYFAMLTTFIAGVTGVFITAKKAVDDFLKLDNEYSNVMKYTGMTRDQVVDLNESFKKMDTKTSRIELNKLAEDAGRLGKLGKQDLLDFAEAGDIIKTALGEDLGENAITDIGKLAQMFGDADKMGLKKAMLATGSAVNYIGQTSSAAEGYLVEFTKRMAGTGVQADIAIPKLLGYGSVLDQNGQQVEAASTALQNVMGKMFQDPARLAKIAGIEVKSFSKLVKEDANEAMLTLLSKLGSKGGMLKLAPMFQEMKLDGVRASQTLSLLAANVDNVRQQQAAATKAFKEGTSVVSEFNVKNNDLTAKMEKAKKAFQERIYQLGEKLLPITTNLVSGSTALVKVMGSLITFTFKNAGALITLSTAVVGYYIGLKVANLYQERAIFLQRLSAVSAGVLKGSLYLLQIAYYLLTGQMAKARGAMVAFNLVTKLNPYAALAALVVGIAAAFIYFTKKASAAVQVQKDLNEIQKTVDEGMASHKSTVDLLVDTIHNENLANADRLKAIKDLQKIIPDYNANISKEGKIVDENTGAIKRYMSVLEAQLKMEASREKLKELYQQQFNSEEKANQYKSDLKDLNDEYSKSTNNSPDVGGYRSMGRSSNIGAIKSALDKEEQGLKDTNARISKIKAYYQMSMKNLSDLNKKSGGNGSTDDGDKVDGDYTESGDKNKKDIFAPLEADYQKKRAALKKKYLDGDIKTEEEYNRKMEELEFQLLNDKLKVKGVEPEKIADINQQILDAKIKVMDQLSKLDDSMFMTQEEKDARELDQVKKKYEAMRQIIEQAYNLHIIPTKEEKDNLLLSLSKKQAKEENKVTEKLADDIATKKDKAFAEEIFQLNEKRMSTKMSEKQYNKELQTLTINYLKDKLKITGLSEEQIISLKKESQDLQLQQFQEDQERQLEKQREYSQLIEDVLVTFAQSTADFFSSSKKDVGEYLKSIVILMLDSLEKVLEIKMAEAAIISAAGGPIGWLSLAIKTAAMKAAFAAAKAAIGNFYDGGYTPGGAWDKPQGIVHSNEFVSNRFAVANPQLRPVFDLIDYAQRNNTVANLTGSDVAAVVQHSSGSSVTPATNQPTSNNSPVEYAVLLSLVSQCNKTMQTVKDRFDSPIIAETYATGKRGTIEAEKLVNKMKSNVSRKS